jgi:hypothetical protein
VNIYDFVKKQRDSYRTDTVTITDGYDFNQCPVRTTPSAALCALQSGRDRAQALQPMTSSRLANLCRTERDAARGLRRFACEPAWL